MERTKQLDRKWEKVPSGTKPKAVRKAFERYLDVVEVEDPYSLPGDAFTTLYNASFSTYGAGHVVDIVLNNQYHATDQILGVTVGRFGNKHQYGDKSRTMQLALADLFDGLKIYKSGNYVTVRVREYAPGHLDFRVTERMLRWSFTPDYYVPDEADDPNMPRRIILRGKATLIGHQICEGLSQLSKATQEKLGL